MVEQTGGTGGGRKHNLSRNAIIRIVGFCVLLQFFPAAATEGLTVGLAPFRYVGLSVGEGAPRTVACGAAIRSCL